MLAVSLLLHIALILGVRFHAPDLSRIKDKLPTLDVVLVNAKTEKAPDKADVLAQANLDRGGNTDDPARAKSPLPVPRIQPRDHATGIAATPAINNEQQHPASKSNPQNALAQKQQQIKQLEQQVQQVVTQLKSTPTEQVAPKPSTQTQNAPLKLNIKEMAAKSLDEASKLEAELAKEQKAYQERPWRKFIGARAEEDRFAFYVEAWRQKVERIGNLNYPEEAKSQKLYGQLRMTVAIRADGNIESIEINKSSGFKVLDNAARRIVELGAPYAAFPGEIRKDTDILEITRTWTFTREDTLSAN
jgi:protein TonB